MDGVGGASTTTHPTSHFFTNDRTHHVFYTADNGRIVFYRTDDLDVIELWFRRE